MIGWALGLALSIAAAVRVLRPERSTADVAITAAAPWLLAPSWLLLAGALFTRQRRMTVLAAGLAAYHATCSRPRPPAHRERSTGDEPQLRVAFANVWWKNRDVRGILGELARGEHDVVALAEVTDEQLPFIEEVLPPTIYPWRWCVPGGSQGLALMSRVPFDDVAEWTSQGQLQLEVTVRSPAAHAIRLLVVHTWGPLGRRAIRRWRAQLAEVAARAPAAAPGIGGPASPTGIAAAGPADGAALPTVIMGDFNANRQHRSFARLVAGWDDAGTWFFGGWPATWPANHWWHPALFSIDHIWAGPGVTVRWGRAGSALGSDHRPVSAALALPPAEDTGATAETRRDLPPGN
jgi:endonuclease/exonuclease/phosphatase (EEP) superfamily protein YafD